VTNDRDLVELADRLRTAVTRLSRVLRQQSATGLTPSMLSALATIDRHGPLTLGALGEHERIAPPSITKVVSKLTDEHLVTREQDPRDRRCTRVELTDEGRTLLRDTRARRRAWLTERLRELDEEEVATLTRAATTLEELTGPEDR
jgi:DNA-binding MarR family transcriptional regulator